MFFAIVSVCFLHGAYDFLARAVVYAQYITLNILYEQVLLSCVCSHRGITVYHADRRTVCVVDIHQQVLYAVFRPLFVQNRGSRKGIGMFYAVYRLAGADEISVVLSPTESPVSLPRSS